MAQIVVITKDITDSDLVVNASQYKRGDVVAAVPDDHAWGTEELKNPLFQIIKIPDMSVAEAQALCTEEMGDRKSNPFLWRRAFKIDLDSSVALKTTVGDGSKRIAQNILSTKTEITTLKTLKVAQENLFIA